jgi:hypothetical protein
MKIEILLIIMLWSGLIVASSFVLGDAIFTAKTGMVYLP